MKKLLAVLCILVLAFVSAPSVSASSYETIERRVASSADDILVWYNGSAWVADRSSNWQQVGYFDSTYQSMGGGMRFTNITVSKGADIIEAHLVITAQSSDSVGTVTSRIRGEDVDDAAAFFDISDYTSRRGIAGDNGRVTGYYMDWTVSGWIKDAQYKSSDISRIIQEIVDRSGWRSSNDIVIFWDDHDNNSTRTGPARRAGYSYSSGLSRAPMLSITYSASSSYTNDDVYDIYDYLNTSITELEVKIKELGAMTASLSTLSSLDSRVLGSLTPLSERVNTISDKVGALDVKVTDIKTQLGVDSKTLGDLQTRVNELAESVDGLSVAVSELSEVSTVRLFDWMVLVFLVTLGMLVLRRSR